MFTGCNVKVEASLLNETDTNEQEIKRARRLLSQRGITETLEYYGLQNTTGGVYCLWAEQENGFRPGYANIVDKQWPFDEKYSRAVKNNDIFGAALQLIVIERQLVRQAKVMLNRDK